jgi:uncharacterized membrane protein
MDVAPKIITAIILIGIVILFFLIKSLNKRSENNETKEEVDEFDGVQVFMNERHETNT